MLTEIIQLGHVLNEKTIHGPFSAPFRHELPHPHAPFDASMPITEATLTAASDAIGIGDHTGTHVDSLSHVAEGGFLWDGTDIHDSGVQGYRSGVAANSPELRPVVSRGVLLDFPALHGGILDPEVRLAPHDLRECAEAQNIELLDGDAVLLRTGWDELYSQHDRFLQPPFPGPEIEAAKYLSGLRASIVGSDTMAFEAAPAEVPLAVHAEFIVRNGIQIMEMLDLRELASRQIYTFTFVLAPLRIMGGTGSPVNPLALIG